MTPFRPGLWAAALVLAMTGGCAPANPAVAAGVCHIPTSVRPAPALPPPDDEIVRDVPTAAYMLALSWAPEICRTQGARPDLSMQCEANAFGFVLHGLWPNGPDRRHPRYCGPAPAISAATVQRHLCMTPSPASLQHEWAAHGTCGWATPEAYFEDASRLWRSLRLPPMPTTAAAGQIRDAFVAANPTLRRDGIYIKATDSRLEDVRICYDLKYRPASCPGGLGAIDRQVLQITPRRPR